MQRSTTKQAIVGLSLSSLTVLAALSPQYGPRFIRAVINATPLAFAQAAPTSEDQEKAILQAQINAKNAQLREVQAKLDAAKSQLNNTTGQRKTLQSEVNRLEGQINTLELGIREDELTVDKLGLEITSLNDDVATLRDKMKDKQSTIGALLVEMQKTEGTSPLIALLQANSLSDTVREAHSQSALRERMRTDLASLQNIENDVLGKIDLSNDKRSEAEQRQENAKNKRLIVADQQADKAKVLASTKNQESVYQSQVAALLKQQQQIAAETEAIDAALRAKINKSTLPTTGAGVLGRPVTGPITQGYGATAFAQTGYAGKRHNGIDFGTPIGTPIYAAADGTVSAVENQDAFCPRGAYGRFTTVTHGNGLVTLYAHQSKQSVSVGQAVTRGQVIGYTGMTGYATGPHLHFTVYAQSTFKIGATRVCGPGPQGGDLNPLNYI